METQIGEKKNQKKNRKILICFPDIRIFGRNDGNLLTQRSVQIKLLRYLIPLLSYPDLIFRRVYIVREYLIHSSRIEVRQKENAENI